ncbi:MAG TPA: diacylglycerol kinase family protein [Pseudonocardiaceae bacterium]|jgi:diacylglycerol kinase family enzyme
MRALLIVNPHATSTTPAGRDVLAAALASELKLDVAATTHRGHAAQLAEQATRDGLDVVVVHGGDGTVNEVVNGLLAVDGALPVPAIGVVPSGSANVFGAGVGVPRDPVEATRHLLRALQGGSRRTIGLGRLHAWPAAMADRVEPALLRWFTFNAGLGLDAVAVRLVERARAQGRRATTARYVLAAVRSYFRQDRGHPALTLQLPGEERVHGVHLAIVANSDPYTFAGNRPVRMNPGCSQDDGLGLFALRSLALLPVLRHTAQILRRTGEPHGRRLVRRQDLPWVTVISEVPIGLQVDGDYLGEYVRVDYESVPCALSVVV